jgi:hypothetical protein
VSGTSTVVEMVLPVLSVKVSVTGVDPLVVVTLGRVGTLVATPSN